ncbi:MAG: replication-associated recombination protein A [Defluviitaleaceae bacterium]|nr:replication-associated recombination protein A [Defluviitaleaceae bacterium]
MNLFDYEREKKLKTEAPLATRMRPSTLEEFIGQEHIVGKGKLLYRAIKADKLTSVIFFGPPGTGKTTLARIIANTTKANFVQLNATTSGVKDIKATVDDARSALGVSGRRTILFIDEIHRFNKSQQDALLPHVEDGTVTLIGATTENPYYEVIKALVSRSVIFELKPLTHADILSLLETALKDERRGLGAMPVSADADALSFLADIANGDARKALNAVELAVLTTEAADSNGGTIKIDLSVAEECIQKRALAYDKGGDGHYDTISAFIKSMRGSDPDAALYYLARMLYAGEDPKFIARRIVICASEDVGNADPHALQVAVAAMHATEFIGLPECQITLAQAVTYIACAPKSNAALGVFEARDDVASVPISGIPAYLRDSNSPVAADGYLYSHDFPGNYVKQQYLPDELVGKQYYKPSDNGVEKKIKESLARLRGGVI